MRSFMFYDPSGDLAAINIPILAVFGGKDTQVTDEQNGSRFKEVCAESDLNCTLEVIPDANHLFQKAETGMMTEYQVLPKEFIEGFLPLISGWINAQN